MAANASEPDAEARLAESEAQRLQAQRDFHHVTAPSYTCAEILSC